MAHKRLGEILREQGKVTEDQIKSALDRQSSSDTALGRILFDMGFVSEDDVSEAWSTQLGTTMVDLASAEIKPEVVHVLPRGLAEAYRIFPMNLNGGELMLAMSEPIPPDVLQSISELYDNVPVRAVVTTAPNIAHAISRYYEE